MQKQAVSVECYINLDEAEQDAALQRIFTNSLPEQVAVCTLRASGVDTAATQAYTLSLVISDDDEMQALNKQYRHQDKPTDVLSFPLLDAPLIDAPAEQLWMAEESEEEYDDEDSVTEDDKQEEHHSVFVTPPELATNLGDIVISWPTVTRQAAQAGHSPVYELLFLLAHGILHLIGYDDQIEAGYAAMVSIQEEVMGEIAWEAAAG
jgi:probable rRNA maturation factor